ncbi:hypothetical protein HMPREF1508_0452 [Shuttleworthella sp. MSX8B]|nr:hypothetical protein HMPREF1508_0452 [Shuttleworthia sp. MSX8B]
MLICLKAPGRSSQSVVWLSVGNFLKMLSPMQISACFQRG